MSWLLNRLLTFSVDHQILVLSLLGLAVLAIILTMLYVLQRPGRNAVLPGRDPQGPPDTAMAATADKPPVMIDKAAAKAFRSLLTDGLAGYRAAYSRNPYLMPWLLTIGGSDPGGLLSAAETIRPAVGLAHTDSLRWRYYEGGIVLSLADPGKLKPLLGFLGRRRPALPLDGVIVFLPLAKLADAQTAAAFGSEIYNQLWEIQRQLGFTVPVYMVVTGTEDLEGFRSFEAVLPQDLRAGILGWSFPFPLETAFSADHVKMALTAVEEGMLAVILEAFGSLMSSPQASTLIRCKQDLASLEEPLTAFLGVALRRTAFQECHYFRGLFFITRPLPAAPASFAADLLERKIFAEGGLSKPLGKLYRWRSWRRYLWPLGVPAACLAMLASLWISLNRIEDYRDQVIPILKVTAADVETLSIRPAGDLAGTAAGDAVARYLQNVAVIGDSTPFLPLPQSWLGGDPYRVAAAMRAGWHRTVLRALKLILDQRLAALSEAMAGDTPDTALADFLTRLKDAEAYAGVFKTITRGNAEAPVADILRYAFNLSPPSGVEDQLKSWSVIGEDAPPVDDPGLAVDPLHYQAATRAAFHDLTDRYFRHLAEGGQLAARLALVAGELEALSTGRRPGAAAESGFAEVSAGLEEAAALLSTGRPSWIGAKAPMIPPDILKLLDGATNSALLGPTARDEVVRLAGQRFAEVKDQLGHVGSVIGPLASRQADGGATLTAEADGLRQLLGQWLARPFMRHGAASPVIHRQELDPLAIEAVPPLFDDYLLFATKTLPLAPPQLRPAMQRAAQFRLQSAVDGILEPSQLLIDPRFVERAGQTELREAARILRSAFPVLEQAIQSYLQIGMPGPAEALRAQVDRAAASIIERLGRIVDTDQLYRPNDMALAAWENGPLSAPELFNQRGAGGLAEHLIASRLEIASLARDIASPMVEILERPLLMSTQSYVAARWRGILAALDQYDGTRPNSSLMQLERFIRDDLGKIDTANCASLRSTDEGAATDWFAERLVSLRDDIKARCYAVTDARLFAGYRQIAQDFNEHLAGRLPFAAADPVTPAEGADPEMIRRFYQLVDLHAKDVLDPVHAFAATHADWHEAGLFLDAMTRARDLLMHLANGGSLSVLPHFRVNRDRETGGKDIIEWRLQVADQTVSSFAARTPAVWTIGDAIGLDLRWAKDAPVRPVRPLGPQAAGLQNLTASFRQQNPWALLAFIRASRSLTAERPPGLRFNGPVLEFSTETGDGPAAAAVEGAVKARMETQFADSPDTPPSDRDDRNVSRVFMSLELRKLVDADGKLREEPVSLPGLPDTAPNPGGSLPAAEPFAPARAAPPLKAPAALRLLPLVNDLDPENDHAPR